MEPRSILARAQALACVLGVVAALSSLLSSCERPASPSPASPAAPDASGAPQDAWRRSVAWVEQALARHRDHAGLLQVLGLVHQRRGCFDEALATQKRLMEIRGARCDSLMACGDIAMQKGDAAAALEFYRQARAATPPVSLLRNLYGKLGEAHFAQGDYQESILALRESVGAGMAPAELHHLLARSLDARALQLRQSAAPAAEAEALEREAVAQLEKGLLANPAHLEARILLGTILRRQGTTAAAQAALEDFQRRKFPNAAIDEEKFERSERRFEARSLVALAWRLAELGERELLEAQRLLEQAVSLAPDAWETRLALGKLLAQTGRMTAGAAHLHEATKQRVSLGEAWEMLAEMALEHGIQPERAIEFGHLAQEHKPDDNTYTLHAMALFKAGRLLEAQRVLEEGLQRFPNNPHLLSGMQYLQQERAGR